MLGINQSNSPVIRSKNYSIRTYSGGMYIVPHSLIVKINDNFDIVNNQNLTIEQINLKLNRQMILDRFNIQEFSQSIAIRFRTNLDNGKSIRHQLKHQFQKKPDTTLAA